MKLKGKRIVLSLITDQDISDMHRLFSNPQVARYNTIGIPENEAKTQSLLVDILTPPKEAHTAMSWTIRSEDHTFLGEVGINLAPRRYRKAEIHYSLLPEYWGKGYASEAVNMIVKFCFDELNLHRIEAGVAVGNLASIRLLERMGFTKEGRKRKVLPLLDGWSDNFHFGILDTDRRIE